MFQQPPLAWIIGCLQLTWGHSTQPQRIFWRTLTSSEELSSPLSKRPPAIDLVSRSGEHQKSQTLQMPKGGAKAGHRTNDLTHAIRALYQLNQRRMRWYDDAVPAPSGDWKIVVVANTPPLPCITTIDLSGLMVSFVVIEFKTCKTLLCRCLQASEIAASFTDSAWMSSCFVPYWKVSAGDSTHILFPLLGYFYWHLL